MLSLAGGGVVSGPVPTSHGGAPSPIEFPFKRECEFKFVLVETWQRVEYQMG